MQVLIVLHEQIFISLHVSVVSLRNRMVALVIPLISHDADTSASGII